VSRATRWARLIARPCRLLFTARPLPDLQRPRAGPWVRDLRGHS
jgi:hypothetical protein